MASKLYIYDKSSEIDREQAAGRFEGDDDVLTIGVSLGVMNLKKVFDQLLGSNQTFNRAVLPIGLTPNAPMDSVARWAGPTFPSR